MRMAGGPDGVVVGEGETTTEGEGEVPTSGGLNPVPRARANAEMGASTTMSVTAATTTRRLRRRRRTVLYAASMPARRVCLMTFSSRSAKAAPTMSRVSDIAYPRL
jgi:hypothetical protein